jgi:hypothetical protein
MCIEADDDLQTMKPFVSVLNQLASYHQTLFTQMEELLYGPLQRWQNYLGEVKELRKRLDKCGLEYDEQRYLPPPPPPYVTQLCINGFVMLWRGYGGRHCHAICAACCERGCLDVEVGW